MKEFAKPCCFILIYVILFLYTYLQAISYKNQCVEYKKNISLYSAAGISVDTAKEMQEMNRVREKQYNFVVWGEKEDICISNSELMRMEEVTLLTACGDTDIICTSKTSLEKDDSKGCLIDTGTAQNLFGVKDITNQELQIEGKQYIVRGMITDIKNVIVIEAGEKEQILNRITIQAMGKNINSIANNFKNIFGIKGILIDIAFLYDLLNLAFLVVPFVFLFYIFITLGKYRKEYVTGQKQSCFKDNVIENFFKIYTWKYWILLSLQILLIGFGVLFILDKLSFMEIYLPTKWSDFAYWEKFFEERKEILYHIFRLQKTEVEINFYLSYCLAVIYYVAAFFFSIGIITTIKYAGYHIKHVNGLLNL